jgi:tetraacyldisaccharide-1-P 4'-kinase
LQTKAKIFRCKQFVQRLVPFLSWQKTASLNPEEFPPIQTPGCRLAARKPTGLPSAFLVCALGNPERFQRDIQKLGIGGLGAKFFPDHHRLSRKDWQNCADEARRRGADVLITTEKDAIKISEPPDFPLLVAMQSTEMADANEFELVLKKCIEERR